MQRWELSAFDRFVQRQPHPPPDSRLAIIGITENDPKQLKASELDDRTLAELLERIKAQQPLAVGLDLIRDRPVGQGAERLAEIFRTTPNLYGVGKLSGIPGDPYFAPIEPPTLLQQQGQVGDASVMVDGDGVIRRGNLYPTVGERAVPSLGLLLAHRYLQGRGIGERTAPDGSLQLGGVTFPFFEANDGGYVQADASGYQILMDWQTPPQGFPQVSATDVLSGKVPDGWLRGRIVLVGYYTPSLKKDLFYTPLSQVGAGETPRQAYGVEIHANLVQYLLGTVLDGRPVLKAISDGGEAASIGGWLVLGGCAAWGLRRLKAPLLLLGAGLTAAALLSWAAWEGYYLLFLKGWWLPAVPSAAAIWLGALLGLFYIFRERHLDYIEGLEAQVKARTAALEQSLSDLKSAQQQLLAQEKLAFLGRLTAGFCHQFKNPLYLLKHGLATARDTLGEGQVEGERTELARELLASCQEQLERLELLSRLILISPSQKKVLWLEAAPNQFVRSIQEAAVKYRVRDGHSWLSQIERHFAPQLEQPRNIPQQLEIPLFNVIENALDAVLERAARESDFLPEIELHTRLCGGTWEIAVCDNGGGLAPEIAERLFEPFVTSKAETQGLGLGLFISREVMQRLGGEIAVENEPGRGCQFTLRVPVKEKIDMDSPPVL
jgi:adenylate cyclase